MRLHGTFIAYLSQIIILREVGFYFLQKESGLYWSGLMGLNMQINVTTDYAIRIVLYLAIQNKVTASRDIASAMGIPESYILKPTNKLL